MYVRVMKFRRASSSPARSGLDCCQQVNALFELELEPVLPMSTGRRAPRIEPDDAWSLRATSVAHAELVSRIRREELGDKPQARRKRRRDQQRVLALA